MLEDDVKKALETIRPKLQVDGGGIELVSVSEDGKVLVSLTGACDSCPMATLTMKWTVEKFLVDTVPGVTGVSQA
jgi:Fe-S cluster biogenesis protein NfuA